MSLLEDIGVPAGSPTINVDGVRLAYSRTGRGITIVCLHAIGHGGRDFDAFAKLVADQFEVVCIDWPGQGRSGGDTQAPSAARYAELLGGALTRLKIEKPILLGNSIGGAAALIHAGAQPVRALVLCNSGGLIEVTDQVTRVCNFMSRFFGGGARRAWWFRTAFWAYYTLLVLPSAAARGQRKRIIAAGYDVAPVLRDAWLSFGKPEADLRRTAAALDVPVWVAWATGDKVIPLSRCLAAIQSMKSARLTKFGGGHAAFLERPRPFSRAFKRFARALKDPA
jgi:4,5:9,10-diseco-3-hydroxy-5,9,17-trioxoandrosta-1(10),2-diene-4-oate hydrolase